MNLSQADKHLLQPVPAMGHLLLIQGEECDTTAHKDDVSFFKAHPGRMTVIRKAMNEWSEYDRSVRYKQLGLDIPQLWVLVTRATEHNYMVVPLWRGTAFWPFGGKFAAYDALGADDACMVIVRQAAEAGGASLDEMLIFANSMAALSKSPTETVN